MRGLSRSGEKRERTSLRAEVSGKRKKKKGERGGEGEHREIGEREKNCARMTFKGNHQQKEEKQLGEKKKKKKKEGERGGRRFFWRNEGGTSNMLGKKKYVSKGKELPDYTGGLRASLYDEDYRPAEKKEGGKRNPRGVNKSPGN